MPNVITHQLFALEVKNDNIPLHLQRIINENMKEYNIGSSGPDFFFYFNAWPWLNQKEAKRVINMGSVIHYHKITEFFKEVFTECKKHQTQKKISYVAGLLTHWFLDKETHPYIFYKSETPKDPKLSTIHHRLFETTVDYEMTMLIKGVNCSQYPAYKLLDYDNDTVDSIYRIYKPALKEVYDKELHYTDIKTALKHFHGIHKLLYNKNDVKFNLFHSIEKVILKKPYIFTSMMAPLKSPNFDILNLEKKPWYHPVTNKASTKSFVEMFNESIKPCQEVLTLFFHYLKNEVSLDRLLKVINNQSFETGLSTFQEMKYFDSVYK